ncbi:hypothetical protein NUU61_007931 [Penicillium alfredii]|uniref:LIM zinc-binding domain-containing protein n=1 Tax=Penicillium alfredii TaxID=1506179 RepID=A0A9W9JYG6_9EURO|nr:uncharacterized protein NUU61_007931 [Penicillium alfredii]KAJ5086624.1 hypothetical protein NUU61_007931 [Penicillium alfredii]
MHTHTNGQRKVSPPGPSYMSNDQIASYLKDLRTNRPARPTGSRPLPGKAAASTPDLHDTLPPRAASALSLHHQTQDVEDHPRSGSAMSHRRTSSHAPGGGPPGRPLVQEPRSVSIRKNAYPSQVFSHPVPASPAPSYRENGQRRHEKEEARSLRDALQEMDLQDDVRIHQAAQDEATELVWLHQHPGVAYKSPHAAYRNPDATRRSQSPVKDHSAEVTGGKAPRRFGLSKNRHSMSSASSSGGNSPDLAETNQVFTGSRRHSTLAGSSKKNLKVNFALPPDETPSDPHPVCGPRPRDVSSDSSKGIFRNPNDHIYEEPSDSIEKEHQARHDFSKSDSSALRNKPRNALPRAPKPLPWLRDRNSNNSPVMEKISRFEIHKNPPSQSRNAGYTSNDPVPQPQTKDDVPTKNGKEIRSDDIRAATSKKLKDRSESLPMPSAVSDKFGRPIVSFDPSWQPSDQPKPNRQGFGRQEQASPSPAPAAPAAPVIEVSEAPPVPVINVPDIKEPTISEISEPPQAETKPTRQPSPTKNSQTQQTAPRKPVSELQDRWYSPYTRSGVPTARCECCSLSISGKIVTAGGSRFHPECFTCFHCQTPLECVAFYQEPEASRTERLANASIDKDARTLRFYCHLDFHELFSPRCKSCKTPIEGEVVVACGAEWHVGHFFCAECGDPFNSQTPFVEKDGFAWCLGCHSRRTAPRCLGCKQNVMDDVVITAIGGQWHDRCFACHECGDGFGPDGRFFVREGEPRRTAKGRIIGGPVQLAICEKCEGIRLKAPGMC